MLIFHSTCEVFRRHFFKHTVDDAEKAGIPPQDRDGNTNLTAAEPDPGNDIDEKLEHTAAELDPGNDINTQLQPHTAETPICTWIPCRIGFMGCMNCARYRTWTHQRAERQHQATSGVTVLTALGQRDAVEIVVQAPRRGGNQNNSLPPLVLLTGYPLSFVSAMVMCQGN